VATASRVVETNVAVALRHTHLPRLADAGVVDYDPDSGRVAPAAAADRLRPYLDLTAREDRPGA
jgi:predicted transcriptional regulator